MHVKHYCLGSGGSRTSDFGRKLQVSLSLPFSSPLILPFASSPSHSIPRLTASEINLLRSPPNSLAWFQNLLLTLICTHLGGMEGGGVVRRSRSLQSCYWSSWHRALKYHSIHVRVELSLTCKHSSTELTRAGASLSDPQYSGEALHEHFLTSTRLYPSPTPFFPPLFNSKSTELLTGSEEVHVVVFYTFDSGAIVLKVREQGISSQIKKPSTCIAPFMVYKPL